MAFSKVKKKHATERVPSCTEPDCLISPQTDKCQGFSVLPRYHGLGLTEHVYVHLTLTSSFRGNRAAIIERLDLFGLGKQDSAVSDLQTANACEHILRWSERTNSDRSQNYFLPVSTAECDRERLQPFPDVQCGHEFSNRASTPFYHTFFSISRKL